MVDAVHERFNIDLEGALSRSTTQLDAHMSSLDFAGLSRLMVSMSNRSAAVYGEQTVCGSWPASCVGLQCFIDRIHAGTMQLLAAVLADDCIAQRWRHPNHLRVRAYTARRLDPAIVPQSTACEFPIAAGPSKCTNSRHAAKPVFPGGVPCGCHKFLRIAPSCHSISWIG